MKRYPDLHQSRLESGLFVIDSVVGKLQLLLLLPRSIAILKVDDHVARTLAMHCNSFSEIMRHRPFQPVLVPVL